MSETRGKEDLNENTAFVVYGKLGQPLAYVIPIEEEKLTELQMRCVWKYLMPLITQRRF